MLTDKYAVTPQTLMMAKDKMIVMHPLPRLDEVSQSFFFLHELFCDAMEDQGWEGVFQ